MADECSLTLRVEFDPTSPPPEPSPTPRVPPEPAPIPPPPRPTNAQIRGEVPYPPYDPTPRPMPQKAKAEPAPVPQPARQAQPIVTKTPEPAPTKIVEAAESKAPLPKPSAVEPVKDVRETQAVEQKADRPDVPPVPAVKAPPAEPETIAPERETIPAKVTTTPAPETKETKEEEPAPRPKIEQPRPDGPPTPPAIPSFLGTPQPFAPLPPPHFAIEHLQQAPGAVYGKVANQLLGRGATPEEARQQATVVADYVSQYGMRQPQVYQRVLRNAVARGASDEEAMAAARSAAERAPGAAPTGDASGRAPKSEHAAPPSKPPETPKVADQAPDPERRETQQPSSRELNLAPELNVARPESDQLVSHAPAEVVAPPQISAPSIAGPATEERQAPYPAIQAPAAPQAISGSDEPPAPTPQVQPERSIREEVIARKGNEPAPPFRVPRDEWQEHKKSQERRAERMGPRIQAPAAPPPPRKPPAVATGATPPDDPGSNQEQPKAELPPTKEGTEKAWLSPQKDYAEGYARKGNKGLHYVDVPKDHPSLTKAYNDEGLDQPAPYNAFEAGPDITKDMRPVPGWKETEQSVKKFPAPIATPAEPIAQAPPVTGPHGQTKRQQAKPTKTGTVREAKHSAPPVASSEQPAHEAPVEQGPAGGETQFGQAPQHLELEGEQAPAQPPIESHYAPLLADLPPVTGPAGRAEPEVTTFAAKDFDQFKDESGTIDMEKARAEIYRRHHDAIDSGGTTHLIADGGRKRVELDREMKDEKGQYWGTAALAFDGSGKERYEFTKPAKLKESRQAPPHDPATSVVQTLAEAPQVMGPHQAHRTPPPAPDAESPSQSTDRPDTDYSFAPTLTGLPDKPAAEPKPAAKPKPARKKPELLSVIEMMPEGAGYSLSPEELQSLHKSHGAEWVKKNLLDTGKATAPADDGSRGPRGDGPKGPKKDRDRDEPRGPRDGGLSTSLDDAGRIVPVSVVNWPEGLAAETRALAEVPPIAAEHMPAAERQTVSERAAETKVQAPKVEPAKATPQPVEAPGTFDAAAEARKLMEREQRAKAVDAARRKVDPEYAAERTREEKEEHQAKKERVDAERRKTDPAYAARREMEEEGERKKRREEIDQARRRVDVPYDAQRHREEMNDPSQGVLGKTGKIYDQYNRAARRFFDRPSNESFNVDHVAPTTARGGPGAQPVAGPQAAGALAPEAGAAEGGVAAGAGGGVAAGAAVGGAAALAFLAAEATKASIKATGVGANFAAIGVNFDSRAFSRNLADASAKIPYLGEAAASASHGLLNLHEAVGQTARRFARFNAGLALQTAQEEARQIHREVARGNQFGPDLQALFKQQTTIATKWDVLMDKLAPIAFKVGEVGMRLLEQIVDMMTTLVDTSARHAKAFVEYLQSWEVFRTSDSLREVKDLLERVIAGLAPSTDGGSPIDMFLDMRPPAIPAVAPPPAPGAGGMPAFVMP